MSGALGRAAVDLDADLTLLRTKLGTAETDVRAWVTQTQNTKAKLDIDTAPAQKSLAAIDASATKASTSVTQSGGQMNKAFSGFADTLSPVPIGMAGVGVAAGLATVAVVKFGQASFQAASDLAENVNKVNVVFGESADEIRAWADGAAEAFGLSESAALGAAGTFGNMLTAMGFTAGAAADMSTDIVQLAADLGSFNNIGTDEALEKIRAGLVGESEPLRTLGVNLTEAAVQSKALSLGLADTASALTTADKVQARYALILEQTTAAQGDFARTSDGAANSLKTAQASIDDLQASIGQGLIPVVAAGAREITKFAQSITTLIEAGNRLADAMPGESEDGLFTKILGQTALMASGIGYLLKLNDALGYVADKADEWTGANKELVPSLQVTTREIDRIAAAMIAAREAAHIGESAFVPSWVVDERVAFKARQEANAYTETLGRQAEAAGRANERNTANALGIQLVGGEAATAAFEVAKLADAHNAMVDGMTNIDTLWTNATAGVQHYVDAGNNATSALEILDGELAENGQLTVHQQEQYDILTQAVGRYKGGIEDSEGAVVDAAVAQANYTAGLDKLNEKYADGSDPAGYAREVKELAAQYDPAIGQQDVMISSLGLLSTSLTNSALAMGLLMVAAGEITEGDFELTFGVSVEDAQAAIQDTGEQAEEVAESDPTVTLSIDNEPFQTGVASVEGDVITLNNTVATPTTTLDDQVTEPLGTVHGDLTTYGDETYTAKLDVDRSALDTNLGTATDAIDSFMLGGAAPGTTAGGDGTYTAELNMVTTPAIDAIADAQIKANTYTVGPYEAVATANTTEANTNIMNLTANIASVPDAHSQAFVDISPALAELERLRRNMPQSPAEEGPMAFEPDWSWLTADAASDMRPGVGGMVALLAGIPIAIEQSTLNIGDIIRDNVLEGFESTAETVGITSEQMAQAIAEGVQSGAHSLPDVIHLMSTDVIAELVRLRDEAANALTLADVAGTATDDMRAELARLDALLLDYASQTGQSAEAIRDAIADGLDTTAIEEQVLAGWLDLLDDIDDIISGDLQADILSQIASLQTQLAAAVELGAGDAVIAALQEQIAALQEQLALVEAIADTEAAATQTAVDSWLDILDQITSGNVAAAFETHTQRIKDLQQQLRLAILDPTIPPEVTAALQAALAQAQADFAGMQDALRSALTSGLLDDATLQALAEQGGAAFEAFYDSIFGAGAFDKVSDGWNDLAEIPLAELKKLLPKLKDHGLSLIDTLIEQVAAGERPLSEALAFIEEVLGQTFKDAEGHVIDSGDAILDELERLEAALVQDLADAYLNNADAVGPLLAELEALRALLFAVRQEADGTKSALDKLPHNTGGNFSSGGFGGRRPRPPYAPDLDQMFGPSLASSSYAALTAGGSLYSPSSAMLAQVASPTVINEIHQHNYLDSQEISHFTAQQTMTTLSGQLSSGVRS